jgi:aryl-alcohol dehydrogenase-like predicted oxidoreductase
LHRNATSCIISTTIAKKQEAVMIYRKLGRSDIEVPVVIFGAWAIGGWYWGGTDDKQATAAIEKALEVGVNCFDTAPAYGFGHSERVLGKALKGRRDKAIIATKCGLTWDSGEGEPFFEAKDSSGEVYKIFRSLSKNSIIHECDQSLKNLDTDYIDLYQCHWPDDTTPIEETMEALLKLKAEGKIRAIGVSNFTAQMIQDCLQFGNIASDQPKYNLLSREIEKDLVPFCKKKNIGIIAYGPIGQGLLTGKVTMDRKFEEGDLRENFQEWFKPANRVRVVSALEKVKPIAEKYGVTPAQLAINWVIDQPGITAAIVGARNPQQAAENAESANFELEADDRASLTKEFAKLGEPL